MCLRLQVNLLAAAATPSRSGWRWVLGALIVGYPCIFQQSPSCVRGDRVQVVHRMQVVRAVSGYRIQFLAELSRIGIPVIPCLSARCFTRCT